MKNRKQGWLCSAALLLCSVSITANAALINRGSGMIYDDVLDVTWLQDANYARTSGYDFDGLMTWDQATNWANNLTFGGYSDWRLPTLSPLNGTSFNLSYSFSGDTDRGYNTNPNFSELAHMFFNNLGNVSFFSPGGIGPQPGSQSFSSSFVDGASGLSYSFQNILTSYWTDTNDDPFLNAGWAYNFRTNSGVSTGEQILVIDTASLGAWALRDGDVASTLSPPNPSTNVSEPSSIALLLMSGLGICAARKRTKR